MRRAAGRTPRRLAGLLHAQAARAHARADALALAAGAAVRRCWRAILRGLERKDAEAVRRAVEAMRGLPARAIRDGLARHARASVRESVRALRDGIPEARLVREAKRRAGLTEAVVADWIADVLFPPPDADTLEAWLAGDGWEARLGSATSLAMPSALLAALSAGMALGETPRELAARLLPAVRNVESTARRIARTEAVRVANLAGMRSHAQLGDLVAGYRIRATLDARTRPEHAKRDGRTYWAEPGPGQEGYDRMPRPPQEADGSVAWCCRCRLEPILRD